MSGELLDDILSDIREVVFRAKEQERRDHLERRIVIIVLVIS